MPLLLPSRSPRKSRKRVRTVRRSVDLNAFLAGHQTGNAMTWTLKWSFGFA
jgi:hypothetical protein